ncbi:unnamed protein product [Ixodes hexagonus]
MVLEGCPDEYKRQLEDVKNDFDSVRSYICDGNLYESDFYSRHCLLHINKGCLPLHVIHRALLLQSLGQWRLLVQRKHRWLGSYYCLINATERCPSESLARKAILQIIGTFRTLENCSKLEWESVTTPEKCDDERFTRCFKNAVNEIKFYPAVHGDTVESLEKDCGVARSVDYCTRNNAIEGCSEESKRRLGHLESDFGSARTYLCDKNLHESMAEFNQCLDSGILELCLKEQRTEICSRFNCVVKATSKCPSQSLAIKATHHWLNTHRDLNNCPRVDWNSSVAPSPKILLTLVALCISLYPLRKQISSSQLS